MNFKKLENIAAIIVLVAFFFPWVGMGPITFSGFSVPKLSSSPYLYLIYLVPLLALLVLVLDYKNINTKYVSIATGVFIIALFIFVIIKFGHGDTEIFKIIEIGVYLTLIGGVLLIVGGISSIIKSDKGSEQSFVETEK